MYRVLGGDVKEILLELFNYCLDEGVQIPGGSEVNISLLFKKKGSPHHLKNWRPIALSNADYKLLTRILSNRLMEIADRVLHPDQKGFVNDRAIWENVITVQNTLQARGVETKGYLYFLDMEKAYDRVAWQYLYEAMSAINLPDQLILWVSTLYSDLSAKVLVNGEKTGEFQIRQGLRQGDPMSPILFNIAANLFIAAGNVVLAGIQVEGQMPLKMMAFADDTVMGVTEEEDVRRAAKLIALYEKASEDLRVERPEKVFRHLGILFDSTGINRRAMEDAYVQNISNRIAILYRAKQR